MGSLLAHALATAGCAVSVLARGTQAEALQAQGLRLGAGVPVRMHAATDGQELGRQDVVFLCVKGDALDALVPGIAPLCGPDSVIVPVLNGIPWWYFQGEGGERHLAPDDPRGRLLEFCRDRILVGCVTHASAEVTAPGVVHCGKIGPFLFGAVDGRNADAAERVAQLVSAAGLPARAVTDIRHEIWLKLVGNIAFNPVAALTGARVDEICGDPVLLQVVRAAMAECIAVAEAHGIRFSISIEQRIEMARALGPARLSMLQDIERGRPPETAGLLDAVVELGAARDIAAPTVAMLSALVTARARAGR